MAQFHHSPATERKGADGETQTHTRPAWETVRELLVTLWPKDRVDLTWRLVVSLASVVLGKVVLVSAPFYYQDAVDTLSAEGGAVTAMVAVPVFLIIAYGGARIMGLVMGQMRYFVFSKVGEALSRILALKVFRHLHTLSLRYHLDRRTGGLSRIIDRGVGYADFLLSITLFNILPTMIELTLVVGVMTAKFGWPYALVTLLTVVLYVGFTFRVTEWRKEIRREMNETDADVGTKALDSLLNFETVKYFTNERHEAARYDEARAALEDASVRTMTSLAFLNSGQTIIFSGGITVLLLMAGSDVAAGTMTIGEFVMVNALLLQLAAPLDSMGSVYRLIKEAVIDTERLLEILAIRPEIKDRPGAAPLRVDGGVLRFENVDFGYDANRQILHDVSFTVPAGRTLAVVGPTGAGKSTLSRLLFRFYDVQAGAVTIDGQDLRDITQDSLREAIGMVPQDTVLFNDTIAYNIRYGRPDASDVEIEEAARLAQIHDFVASLPKGYDTTVGERGLKLSGGEKQRVAIARTLLKNPPILILDEATSALDTQTERDIQVALHAVSRGRTTLVIAHRLSTVMDADEILVLEKGRIAERGTHAVLLEQNGAYAAMWARQRDLAEAETIIARTRENAGDDMRGSEGAG